MTQILDWTWIEEEGAMSPSASLRSLRRSDSRRSMGSKKTPPSPTVGPVRRKRREVLNALYPVTLDAEVLQPSKLQVALVQIPPRKVSGSVWTQGMLLGLLQKIMART